MQVQVEVLTIHRDQRGTVFEPLGEEGLGAQRNVHVVLSEAGEVRGNHYHRRGTEVLVVQGPALARFRESEELRDCQIPDGEVHRFVIPPGVAHAIRHEGERQGLLVGFNSHAHDPQHPDTVRDVLL
jgi:dTDP-4-dehydrorhamnose 3,5-epimerase-like enzyme